MTLILVRRIIRNPKLSWEEPRRHPSRPTLQKNIAREPFQKKYCKNIAILISITIFAILTLLQPRCGQRWQWI